MERIFDRDRWNRLRELFDQVLELPESQRGPFLDRELAGDAELRAELDVLLANSVASAGFIAEREVPASGTTIGPYRLLETLGEGGFGVVYLAEQLRPIHRRLALKLIKPGMDTKQVIARFETERQALALMDHPGIAQVFEAGETEQGRPYFAMEFVPGVAITTFCDQEQLSLRDRLQLFLQACDAIHHAHQKGVIHRDIKPSNVLVSRRDGVAALKIIDFGIVKATADAAVDERTLTRDGTVLGTVGYMSPEQIGAIAAPVDTRSDIYSLGVVLYELLSGAVPFDRARLRQAAWTEVVRVIREEDPPSLAVHAARLETGEIARRRSTEPRSLLRELKGELEWITLKALERDPNRRYTSASELASDIRRHLAHEPVLAGAPSTSYRMRKYARRHRVGVTAAALVLVALVAGGVIAAIGYGRALRAERLARREAEASAQVADFLVELFHASSPDTTKGQTITARTLLDEGTRRIESAVQTDPLVRARLLAAMGDSYLNLAAFDEGTRLTRAALRASESAQPRDELAIARYLDKLANAYSMAGKTDSIPALVDRTIAILTASKQKDPGLLATALYRRARSFLLQSDLVPADSVLSIAIELAEAQPQPDASRLAIMHSTKGTIAIWRFDLAAAERSFLRALELAEQGGEQMRSATLHGQLATTYFNMGEYEKALPHAQLGVDLSRKLYAPNHSSLARALGELSLVLGGLERYEAAIPAQVEAVAILRGKGRRNEQLAYELNLLGSHYGGAGQLDLAITCAEEARNIYVDVNGPDHFRNGEVLANLARWYAEAGEKQKADASFRAAIDVLERIGDETILGPLAIKDYADLCRDGGRLEQADSLYTRAEASFDSANAAMRPYLGDSLIGRAHLRSLQGRHQEAESMMSTALRLKRGDSADDDEGLGNAYLAWAEVRVRAGDAAGAIERLQRALRCKVTAEDVAYYPLLDALRSRADYPRASSP